MGRAVNIGAPVTLGPVVHQYEPVIAILIGQFDCSVKQITLHPVAQRENITRKIDAVMIVSKATVRIAARDFLPIDIGLIRRGGCAGDKRGRQIPMASLH